MADLVFVFFDPMGQALCKRTLNILESLWSPYSEKIRLYLAKADEAGSETDRQKYDCHFNMTMKMTNALICRLSGNPELPMRLYISENNTQIIFFLIFLLDFTNIDLPSLLLMWEEE